MEITAYSIEELKDPTNIIEGKRYELLLDVEVDEDDELYVDGGLEIRAIIGEINDDVKLLNYFIKERLSEKLLDFALEEEEEQMIIDFFKEEGFKGIE